MNKTNTQETYEQKEIKRLLSLIDDLTDELFKLKETIEQQTALIRKLEKQAAIQW